VRPTRTCFEVHALAPQTKALCWGEGKASKRLVNLWSCNFDSVIRLVFGNRKKERRCQKIAGCWKCALLCFRPLFVSKCDSSPRPLQFYDPTMVLRNLPPCHLLSCFYHRLSRSVVKRQEKILHVVCGNRLHISNLRSGSSCQQNTSKLWVLQPPCVVELYQVHSTSKKLPTLCNRTADSDHWHAWASTYGSGGSCQHNKTQQWLDPTTPHSLRGGCLGEVTAILKLLSRAGP